MINRIVVNVDCFRATHDRVRYRNLLRDVDSRSRVFVHVFILRRISCNNISIGIYLCITFVARPLHIPRSALTRSVGNVLGHFFSEQLFQAKLRVKRSQFLKNVKNWLTPRNTPDILYVTPFVPPCTIMSINTCPICCQPLTGIKMALPNPNGPNDLNPPPKAFAHPQCYRAQYLRARNQQSAVALGHPIP